MLALQLLTGTIDLQNDEGHPFDLEADGLGVLELHIQAQHTVIEGPRPLQVLHEQDDGSHIIEGGDHCLTPLRLTRCSISDVTAPGNSSASRESAKLTGAVWEPRSPLGQSTDFAGPSAGLGEPLPSARQPEYRQGGSHECAKQPGRSAPPSYTRSVGCQRCSLLLRVPANIDPVRDAGLRHSVAAYLVEMVASH